MKKTKQTILIEYTQKIIDELRLNPIEYFDKVYDLVEDCSEELKALWLKKNIR